MIDPEKNTFRSPEEQKAAEQFEKQPLEERLKKTEFECTDEELEEALTVLCYGKLEHYDDLKRAWELSREFKGIQTEQFFVEADKYIKDTLPGINVRPDQIPGRLGGWYFKGVVTPGGKEKYQELDSTFFLPDEYARISIQLNDQMVSSGGWLVVNADIVPYPIDPKNILSIYPEEAAHLGSRDVYHSGTISLVVNPVEQTIVRHRYKSDAAQVQSEVMKLNLFKRDPEHPLGLQEVDPVEILREKVTAALGAFSEEERSLLEQE